MDRSCHGAKMPLAVVRARTELHVGAGYPIIGFGDLVVANVVRHVRQ